MKCLVTGGAGFIGSHLILELLRKGHEVIAVDALLESTYSSKMKIDRFRYLSNLNHSKLMLVEKDLRYESVEEEIKKCEVVINLAAIPGLAMSWENFDLYLSCNVNLVERLVQSLIKVGGRKLVHISTSSVYGKFAVGDERQVLNPCSPYGVTKASAEMLINGFKENFGLDVNILRYFSVYGPGQRPDMAYSKFIRAIDRGEPIKVNGDGLQLRTNTYISDCVDATISATAGNISGQVYNICGLRETSVNESLAIIEDILKKKAVIEYGEKVPGDQQNTKGDISKATLDLNYNPSISLQEGLSRQIESYLKNDYFEVKR